MAPRTPREMQEIYKEALDARDLDRIMSLYEPDAVFVRDNGEVVHGVAKIRALQDRFLALDPEFSHTIVAVVEGPGVAIVSTDWRMSAEGPDGPVELEGRASDIVRRQDDGTWLLVIDHPWARS
jgi:uncharacterized protein (TIGR02246 family)